ncbi:MAG: 23S rRNA (adenine(2503)-C(2))-methyltransferase RlmN [Oscillospiraceae bacterium]|nr:23S rRNA (adenine(2503)-C(2))-methyltransferase RlmN [Oscillospiraceae bacterium]
MSQDVKSKNLAELRGVFAELGEPGFRAGQVFSWLHGGKTDFEEMTNLSKRLRGKLAERFYISAPALLQKQTSQRDGTVKYLWGLRDGNSVESVVMEYAHGNTVCISTQVGCRQGCAFCASTLGGLVRNLTPGEMLDQVLFSQMDSGRGISNVVLMGIGEPLDNFDAVLRFLELVSAPEGMNLGMRHISLSTCGITEKVDKLGDYRLQLTLSVSLHAPDDETRSRLMPINGTNGVEKLFASCRAYFEKTGRRVSYEYALIDGVNDTPFHARLLAKRLRGSGSHVNLILLNHVAERDLRPSRPESVRAFMEILKENGVNHTVRRRLGLDIDAACGQLRRNARAAAGEIYGDMGKNG